MAIETINLSVTIERDLADAANKAVSSGGYGSLSEVVGEALRDWQERSADREHDIARLKAEIDRAADNPVRLSQADVRQHLRHLYASASSTKVS